MIVSKAAVLVGLLIATFGAGLATAQKKNAKTETMCGRVVSYSCSTESESLLLDLDTPGWQGGKGIAISRRLWPDPTGRQLTNTYLLGHVCASGPVAKIDGRKRVDVQSVAELPSITTASPLGSTFGAGAFQMCAEGVTPPELVREVKAVYTREAFEAKQEGRLFLEAVVLPDGSVGELRPLVRIVPEYGLTQQAIDALKQWQFRPGTRLGAPVRVIVTVESKFTLR